MFDLTGALRSCATQISWGPGSWVLDRPGKRAEISFFCKSEMKNCILGLFGDTQRRKIEGNRTKWALTVITIGFIIPHGHVTV